MSERHVRRTKWNTAVTLLVFAALVTGIFFISVIDENLGLEQRPVAFGATFSKPYAEYLGLDWKAAFTASLDDLGLRRYRIPAYWDQIEPKKDEYDFTDLDWLVREAGKRDAKVILAIGRKLPRWPECHPPAWTSGMSEDDIRARILLMLQKTVKRYAKSPNVVAWQVENEPLFDFGVCPPVDREFLKKEVATVKALDSRPVVISESGELSTWIGATGIADIVGISTYRTVWNKYVGYFYWPIGPRYYARRFDAIAPLVDGIIVTELQAEPWVTVPLPSMPFEQQNALMNPGRLRDNVEFTRQIGFPEVYLWGIEWWYASKLHGHPEMWEAGKQIIQEGKDAPGLKW